MKGSVLNQVLGYANKGWRVLPLHSAGYGSCTCGNRSCKSAGKHPRINKWQELCTVDERQILSWWDQWPQSNVGILTGKATGFFVLDVDPRHGGDKSLTQLLEKHGPLPKTLSSVTGGGGQHIYFEFPKSASVNNRANIQPGLDIRGEGGYIIAPPSLHVAGKHYAWDGVESQSILPAPDWFHRLLEHPQNLRMMTHGDLVGEGGRNDFLTRQGGSLRRAGLGHQEIYFELRKLNQLHCTPQLSDLEVSRIASSVSRYATSLPMMPTSLWTSEPEPLPSSSVDVPALRKDMIPSRLAPWIVDIAERMQVNLEFVMAPAIVALSSVIGRKIGIKPKEHDDWLVVPNLWGMIVARPGYFKSPTISEALRPLDHLSEKARQEFEKDRQANESTQLVATMQIEAIKDLVKKALKDGDMHELENLKRRVDELKDEQLKATVIERRYKTNDATVEKISRLLNDNPNGILFLRDELNGWLQTLTKSGREGDREFFLEAWNGYGSYTVDRVGSGTTHVAALCLSVFGGIQPGKLRSYVEKATQSSVDDDGLLQRFQILIYPKLDPNWENIDRLPDIEAREKVFELFKTLDEINVPVLEEEIPFVRFDSEAQVLFNEWRCNLETRLRSGQVESSAFESHLAKYRSLMPSLALLFFLTDDPTQISGDSRVGVSAAKMAIDWCDFLEAHARKVYEIGTTSELTGALMLASKINTGELRDQTPLRSLYRSHWRGLSTQEEVDKALALLEEYGWVRIMKSHVQGGQSKRICIHPKLLNSQRSAV